MRIELAALSSVDTRSLVAEILRRVDPLPEVVLDLVSVRAEGNPFYAEELVKMLIDDGVIMVDSETWRVLPEPFLELKVPDTLTGVLQARLDKLQPPEKLAIQQAAVIGRIFWDEALAALHSEGVDALPTLEVRELVFRREESAFEGTVEYIFKHSILRDVTYETVLKRLRGQYHNLVAGWLAAAAEANNRAEEYAALIGKHYQLGGSLKQAADWYERAGKQAMITFAHAEAVYYLTQALQFTAAEAHASRFTLLEARERAYHMQGDREAQSEDLAALAILADSLGKAQQTRMALRQAEYATATSNYAQAMQYARMAIELAQGGQDIQATAEGHYAWGTALYRQGQYTAAQEQYQLGLQLAREAGNRKQMANCQIGLGNVTNDKGDFAAAMRYYQDALAIWRAAGSEREEASSLNGLGVVAYYQGDFTASRQYYEQSLAIQSRIGNRFGEVVLLTNLGLVAADQGDLVAAKAYHEQSLAISREIDDRYGEGASLSNLAGTLFSEGDYSTAKVYLEQALVIQKAIGDQWGEGNSLNELGAIALMQDNLPQAEQCYQQALAIHQRLNLPHYLAEDRAGLTRVWLAQGKRQEARSGAQQIVHYLQNNARLEGTENPIRALRFTWETFTELGETVAAQGVLESAVEIMKSYLDKQSDTALQAKYLRQLHHQVLWSAWTNRN
jgi:predicted ATPase